MKKLWLIFTVSLMFILCVTFQVHAVPIPGLYNTGVDDNGIALPWNSEEIHYKMIAPAGYGLGTTPYVVSPVSGSTNPYEIYAIPPQDSPSNWIDPQNWTVSWRSDPGGTYYFTLDFDLSNLNPDTAVITGSWATDDVPSYIFLNGVYTGIYLDDMQTAFEVLHPFTLEAGNNNVSFVTGKNTLTFQVENQGYPTALLVAYLQGTASTSVPEPTTMLLLGLGLIGLAGVRRKFQN